MGFPKGAFKGSFEGLGFRVEGLGVPKSINDL